jgi:hypothetical protein
METSTRLSDLPENITTQIINSTGLPPTISVSNNGYDKSQSMPTNYTPLNTHPNPYGISAQNPIMETQQPPPLTENQRAQLQQQAPVRLPSRDISRDTTGYAQDEQIQPNYIPKSNVSSDYVRDYEDMTERNLREYEEKKRKESRLDMLMTEFQIPFFIALLFLLFQLPRINKVLFKRLSFMGIHHLDGNLNFYGMVLKSILFGVAYYFSVKTADYLSEV